MQIDGRRLVGASSELLVAYRFMAAGRVPSWPLVPCAYDLLVDCGDSIQRVQVKTGHHAPTGDAWRVRLTKRHNEKGDRPAFVAAVDYVCVVCEPNVTYVIPTHSLRSPSQPEMLVPQLQIYRGNERFQNFLNVFALGCGCGTSGRENATIRVPLYPTAMPPNVRRRKQRYGVEDIQRLRQELGPNPSRAAMQATAVRLNITEATIRNYLNGNRKDLRTLVETEVGS